MALNAHRDNVANRVADSSWGSCAYCTAPLPLTSQGWKTPTTYAYTATEFLAMLAILISVVMVFERPWLRDNRTRLTPMSWLFAIAGICAVIDIILTITVTLLHQTNSIVTFSYWITYIFSSFTARLADVLLIGIILLNVRRLRSEQKPQQARNLQMVHGVILLLLTVLTTVGFSYVVSNVVKLLNLPTPVTSRSRVAETIYDAVAFLAAVEVVAYTVIFFIHDSISVRENSFLAVIAFFFSVSALTQLVGVQIVNYDTGQDQLAATWAYNFIQLFSYAAIFLALAQLARCDYEKTHGGDQHRSHGYRHPIEFVAPPPPISLTEPQAYKGNEDIELETAHKAGDWTFHQQYVPVAQDTDDRAWAVR